ncbi:hypothetical protein [Desulfosporosinus nitroreducens]|nr:hypothetical protein [Desulfosporosinus nitroreducens]
MNRSDVLFSNLTSDQIEDLKALENKFNGKQGQETILIAYTSPK